MMAATGALLLLLAIFFVSLEDWRCGAPLFALGLWMIDRTM